MNCRKLILALALAVAASSAAPRAAHAQDARADTAGVLLDVATQLQREGRNDLAGALFNLILERYPGTPAAAEVARRRSLAALPSTRMDRGGRAELIVYGGLYGAWLGVAVPIMLGVGDEPSAIGIGLLAGAPAGLLAAKLYADDHLRGEGHARAITLGATWGSWQAFGWQSVLDLGEHRVREIVCIRFDDEGNCLEMGESDFAYTETDDGEVVAYTVAGGLAGIVVGDYIGRHHAITPGMATTANFGALWGSWFGFAGAMLLGVLDDGGDDGDDALMATLIGGDAGLLVSALKAGDWNLTREQARLTSIIGVAGGLAGAGLLLIVRPDDDRVAIAFPLVGSVAGLIAGSRWTRNRAPEANPAPGAGGAALLRLDGGRMSVGAPGLRPALLRNARGTRTAGVHVPIFSATF